MNTRRIVSAGCLLLFSIACVPFQVLAGDKQALAIGINKYENLGDLKRLTRAVNDAKDVGETLKVLGFNADVQVDLSGTEFNKVWQDFLERVKPGDTAAIFFAGHGIYIEGDNFLLPRDVPYISYSRQTQLKRQSISVSELLLDLTARKPRLAIVILDACRDNPFIPDEFRNTGNAKRGLLKSDSPGMFIMYSAAAMQGALDRLPGNDPNQRNSVYTRTLLPLLRLPNLNLRDLAGRVRDEVVDLVKPFGLEQVPAYYDGVVGSHKFCLAGNCTTPQQAAIIQAVPDDGQIVPQIGHTDGVVSLSASHGGDVLVSGSYDSTVKLWNVALGKLMRTIVLENRRDNEATASRDGSLIATIDDSTLNLWSTRSAKLVRALEGNTRVSSVQFAPQGQGIIVGYADGALKLWSEESGKLLRSLQGSNQANFAFFSSDSIKRIGIARDGLTAISGADGKIKIWDMPAGNLRHSLAGPSGGILSGGLWDLAIAPNGLLAASADDKEIKVWDLQSGILTQTITPKHQSGLFSFSGGLAAISFLDNERLVSAGGSDAKIWEARSGKQLGFFEENVEVQRFSEVANDVIFAGDRTGNISLWNSKTGKKLKSFESGSGKISALNLARDGSVLVAVSGQDINLWHPRSGKLLSTLRGTGKDVRTAMVMAGNKEIVSIDGSNIIKIWDVRSAKTVRTLDHPSDVWKLALSADGSTVVGGMWNGTMVVWNARTGTNRISIPAFNKYIASIALAPDASIIASLGDEDDDNKGVLKVWDAASGSLLSTIQVGTTMTTHILAAAPGGAFVVDASGDQRIRVWNGRNGQLLQTLPLERSATELGVSADGRKLAARIEGGKDLFWDIVGSTVKVADDAPDLLSAPELRVSYAGGTIVVKHRDGNSKIEMTMLPAGNWVSIGANGLTYTGSKDATQYLMFSKGGELKPLDAQFVQTYRREGLAP